jgi:N-acetylneuraminate synthase
MLNEIIIGHRSIGPKSPPYIIAELSANHNSDICRAFKIMEAAKIAGADAIKLQTYSADTITIDSDRPEFQIQGGAWDGRSLYELYKWAQMPWDWHKPLFEKARELDITIFSSPFDCSAVDFLEQLNPPAYKIASFESVDLQLINYVAQTGKPMLISTGMASKDEIEEAVATARDGGCRDLVLLHCVSGYPAHSDEYNLATIPDMAKRFGVLTGLSDHTLDNTTAIAAVALGACVIEKHVTLDRNGGGPDDNFSMEPDEFSLMIDMANAAFRAVGNVDYQLKESEIEMRKFRRSLYAVANIKKGEILTEKNVRSIRPGFGLHTRYLGDVLGKKANCDIERGTALRWDLILR